MTRAAMSPSTEATDARRGRWEFAPYALLRAAGLPLDVAGALRFTRCVEQLDRHAALTQAIEGAREALSTALHDEVRRHREHAETRRSLIELRRDLYSLKRPSGQALEGVWEALSPEARERVESFCRALDELAELCSGFPAVLSAEQEQKRAWLRELLRTHEGFHAAIEMANPSVGERLVRYASEGSASSPRKVLEETLVTYLMRGAVKTSPLSRFAWTSVLPWPPEPGPHLHVELDPGSFRSSVELHRTAYRILLEQILAHEELGPRLRYQINPDMQQRGEHAFVFTRERSSRIVERYGRLRLRAPHVDLLERVRRHGSISLLRLAEEVSGDRPVEQVLPLLTKLVEAGLLAPRLAMGDDQTNPLGYLASALRETSLPLGLSCAEHLEAILRALSRPPELSLPARRAERASIQRSVDDVLALLSPDQRPPLPPHLLYEDAIADVRRITAPPELSRPELGGADVVAELSLFLQESVEPQLRDIESFVRRYGVGGACEDVYAFFLQGQEPSELAPAPQVEPYLQELRARCDDFQAHQRAFYSALLEVIQARGDQEEVCLDPAWVLERLRPHPFRRSSYALTLFLQPVPRADAYVINTVFAGQGALLSRFAPQLEAEEAGSAVLRRVREVHQRLASPARPVHLMLASNYSVGVCPPLTAEALYVPGAPPAARAEGELRLKDVVLRHDASQHELQWVDRAGRRLSPLQLSVVAAPLLPPISQRITRLNPQVILRPVSILRSMEALSAPVSGSVRAWPRIRVGNFILSRRTWVLYTGDELARRKAEGELSYWLRLRQWADEKGLPRRFFVSPYQQQRRRWSESLAENPNEPPKENRSKPQPIDLDSAFLVRALEKLLPKVEMPCALQEALPTPEDAAATVEGRPHAMELCLELLLPPGA